MFCSGKDAAASAVWRRRWRCFVAAAASQSMLHWRSHAKASASAKDKMSCTTMSRLSIMMMMMDDGWWWWMMMDDIWDCLGRNCVDSDACCVGVFSDCARWVLGVKIVVKKRWKWNGNRRISLGLEISYCDWFATVWDSKNPNALIGQKYLQIYLFSMRKIFLALL